MDIYKYFEFKVLVYMMSWLYNLWINLSSPLRYTFKILSVIAWIKELSYNKGVSQKSMPDNILKETL